MILLHNLKTVMDYFETFLISELLIFYFIFFNIFTINMIIFRHGWLVFALPTWKKYWFLDFQRVHWPSFRSSWTNCWNSMKSNDLQLRGRINLTIFFVICAPYNASYFLHLIENIFMYVLRMHDFTWYSSILQIL